MQKIRVFNARDFAVWLLVYQVVILISLVEHVPAQGSCGSSVLQENATFKSPNYPSSYQSYGRCTWSITVPEGHVAVIRFQAFRTESCTDCRCDYLKLYDGPDADSPVLGSFCGSSVPSSVYATQNKIYARFEVDGSVEYSGFSATVSKGSIRTEDIVADNGTVQSPNYPNNYGPLLRNIWNVTVPENHQILVKLVSFQLQLSNECIKDFLEIRDGPEFTSPVLGRFCGTDVPNYVRSTGNKITIAFQSDDSQEEKGFLVEFRKVEICSEVLIGDNGTLHSPNYPSNYGPMERCRWTIHVPEDHQITFKFLAFHLSTSQYCKKDFVQIYDGNTTAGRSLGRFCGSDTPNDTRSSKNEITVDFQSDFSEEGKGFVAFFEKSHCGENFESDSGTFHSPNYPNTYRIHELCVWKITVPDGYQVALVFESLRLEHSDDCKFDYIIVADGHNSSGGPVLGKYCGESVPQKILSSGNTMSVRFGTDGSVGKSGFSAVFTKAAVPVSPAAANTSQSSCYQDIQADSGNLHSPRYPQSYPPQTDCTWNIRVPPGQLIRLQFQSFDLEAGDSCPYDFVKVFDGNAANRSSLVLGTFCGADDPVSLWSSSNMMSVRFVADTSFEHPGFSATFTKVDSKSEIITADSGTLESPNYPNNYGPAQKREWKISVQDRYVIYLKFLTFHVEYSQNCTDDFVEIYDGDKSLPSSSRGRFCGSQTPSDIRTTGNVMTIIFATDTSEEGKGFSAEFEKEAICSDGSCRNGGECIYSSKERANKCFCKYGYRGNLCEEKILCSNNTCEHGGLCFQNGTKGIFTCICKHGYEGLTCGERILCGNETCQNDGYCTHEGKNGIFLCVCEKGYEGLWCEKAIETDVPGRNLAAIVVPVVVILGIASVIVLFLLIRRSRRQQPYGDIKNQETLFRKGDDLDS